MRNPLVRFAEWVRQDYPGPKGPHLALLAVFPPNIKQETWGFVEDPTVVLEVIRDDDNSIWIGWRRDTKDRGRWWRLTP